MLLPKRVKYRRQHRGRMKGAAHKGNYVAYGDFGLQALEPSWITSNQIEAARVAMTRYIKQLVSQAPLCLKSVAYPKSLLARLCVWQCTNCQSSANSSRKKKRSVKSNESC